MKLTLLFATLLIGTTAAAPVAEAQVEPRAMPGYCLASKECSMATSRTCGEWCGLSNWDGSITSVCTNGKWSCCCTKKQSAGPWIGSVSGAMGTR